MICEIGRIRSTLPCRQLRLNLLPQSPARSSAHAFVFRLSCCFIVFPVDSVSPLCSTAMHHVPLLILAYSLTARKTRAAPVTSTISLTKSEKTMMTGMTRREAPESGETVYEEGR